jgi:hypothetical protein
MTTVSMNHFRNLVRVFIISSIVSTISMLSMAYRIHTLNVDLASLKTTVSLNDSNEAALHDTMLRFDEYMSEDVTNLKTDLEFIKSEQLPSEVETFALPDTTPTNLANFDWLSVLK